MTSARTRKKRVEAVAGWLLSTSVVACAAAPKAEVATPGFGVEERFSAGFVPGPASPPPAPKAAPARAGAAPEPATPGPESALQSGATGTESPAELLVYEATIVVAVYQVEEAIDRVLSVARREGGQVVVRGDDQVAFRVPRERFDDALAAVDRIGDVLHRDVRAEDVGDRYRDLEVRLRNARAMRDRLERLLEHADGVDASLKIEQELSRVTAEIERLAGELQLLGQRVAYSRVTVAFRARHTEDVRDEAVRLPFPWLGSLGLARLLELREGS
jgi:hypothetical protein